MAIQVRATRLDYVLALITFQSTEITPMATKSPQHHSLNYIEFIMTDMAKAQEFYTAAFGWSFNAYGPDYAGIVINDDRLSMPVVERSDSTVELRREVFGSRPKANPNRDPREKGERV